jgi:uncharacterized protein (TIGR00299 family) protein
MAELTGLALHFDCFSGIAGDMTLGALLDLGVPLEAITAELGKLPLKGYKLWHERVQRGALVGTKAHVDIAGDAKQHAGHRTGHHHHHDHDHEHHHHDHEHHHDHDHEGAHGLGTHHHTHWREIRAMLQANLTGDVLARAMAIFDRVAVVEARLHGVSVEDVAFHEVGAVDSIVDIVGAAAGLAWLKPARVTARRVPLGGGSVMTAHGRLPVPAPATLEILAGAEVEPGIDADGELTTPTGAAILAASVSAYGPMPAMQVRAVGWGAGDRELRDRPNLLRVVVGRPVVEALTGDVMLVEANIDDMNPELVEPLFESLFAAGALDVWTQPITMKKSRPALLVAALCDPARQRDVTEALLRESTTIGVRHRVLGRTVLERRFVDVDTPYGPVTIKLAGADSDGAPLNVAPEYESCRARAKESNVAVKLVYQAALAAYYRR